MVEYPPGEPKDVCAICEEPFEHHGPEFASNYANLVCRSCDERATTEESDRPKVGNEFLGRDTVTTNDDGERVIRLGPDVGDNPVFIGGQQCWRRYRFGGWVTLRDDHDCDSLEEFYQKHRDDF